MTERKTRVWQPELTAERQARVDALDAEIGRRISALRTFRQELGLSQAELAEILQTTQSNVSKLEGGRRLPLEVLSRVVTARKGKLRLVAEIDGREISLPLAG